MSFKVEEVIGAVEKKHIMSLLEKNTRLDGRMITEVRQVEITTNVIKKAEGSAKVRLGKTVCIAGVKTDIGTPFPDTPNKGVIIVNIELSPIASPTFESGPPKKRAIELARVVDRGLRESEVIDLEKLCIIPGEKVWIVFVDIYVLDYYGNLFDAASIASMAALASTKLPKIKYTNEEKKEIVKSEENEPMPLNRYASSITFAKVDDIIIVDPMIDEEYITEARFTVAFTDDGKITAIQKGLAGTFSEDEISFMLEAASKHIAIRIQTIKQAVNESKDLVPGRSLF